MSDEKKPTARPETTNRPMSDSNPPDSTAPGSVPSAEEPRSLADVLADDLGDDLDILDTSGISPGQMKAIIEVLQADLEQARNDLAAKDAQLEAANEKVLRAMAEIENMRKRVEREKEEIGKYAITKLARDIVLVADNFERAIQSVPEEARIDNPALTSLIEGVSLTEREFLNTLERHGVRRVAPQGEPFNPHLHQAVMEQSNPDVPSGTVLQVFQVGYLIEDRLIRPAMVAVSTGGPKVAKPANGNGNTNVPPGAGEAA